MNDFWGILEPDGTVRRVQAHDGFGHIIRENADVVYAQWENLHARTVGRDEVGPAIVSTVFLPTARGRDLWFETLVTWENGPMDGQVRRYQTIAEARAGHAETVAAVRLAVDAEEFAVNPETPPLLRGLWRGSGNA